MDAADLWAADGLITRAIGEEIRRVRESAGWTRSQLVERMPTDIHIRTLAAYEQGSRQCAVVRLVEICLVLGVAPEALLGLALHRAEIDLQTLGIEVDLHAVMRDEQAELAPLRSWACKRLQGASKGAGIAHLNYAAIQEMAILLDFTRSELIRHLSRFTPQAAPLS
jgi:transcriptional regulator with XRE-family HTH domain